MDIKTLKDANLVSLLTAKFAYEFLAKDFGEHVEAWQTTVVDRVNRSGWTGSTADTAHKDLAAFSGKLKAAHQELILVQAVLADAHRSIASAQSKLIQVLDDAKAGGIKVADDGGMSWDNDRNSSTFAGPGAANRAEALSTRLQAALAEGAQADEAVTRRLRHFVENATSGTGLNGATAAKDRKDHQTRTDYPGDKASAEEIKTWWNNLSPAEQNELINSKPELIGNRDGIPAVDRDEANRIGMQRAKDKLQYDLDHLGPEPEQVVRSGHVFVQNPKHEEWESRKSDLESKLNGIKAIEDRLGSTVTPDQPPAYLLGFDTEGRGHAIVAVNNPDTADNVVTYVPGTGSSLGNIKGDIGRSDGMVGAAQDADSGKTTSSITWVGYDSPPEIPNASSPTYAEDARQKLADFENGLRTTHEGRPSHNTIIGHSYGSTTVGLTLRDKGLPVDEVIFVGSPGVGVDEAKDFRMDPKHIYAGRGDADSIEWAKSVNPIDWAQEGVSEWYTDVTNGLLGMNPNNNVRAEEEDLLRFGRDPANDRFGAQRIPTDSGTGHSDYWKGSSLDTMGDIIAGKRT
ncbi:alpha/beta hydrolase [Kitasatospora sp. NPDC054939]